MFLDSFPRRQRTDDEPYSHSLASFALSAVKCSQSPFVSVSSPYFLKFPNKNGYFRPISPLVSGFPAHTLKMCPPRPHVQFNVSSIWPRCKPPSLHCCSEFRIPASFPPNPQFSQQIRKFWPSFLVAFPMHTKCASSFAPASASTPQPPAAVQTAKPPTATCVRERSRSEDRRWD
jgi:hypothetical protein